MTNWVRSIVNAVERWRSPRDEPAGWVCASCGKVHRGLPAAVVPAPAAWVSASETERKRDFQLTSDTCIWKNEHYFVRCRLEIPLLGRDDVFSFGVWSSLSDANFSRFMKTYGKRKRGDKSPMFGWLSNELPGYPSTLNLACQVYPQDDRLRPLIALEPTAHPLSVQQRSGMTFEAAAAYAHEHMGI